MGRKRSFCTGFKLLELLNPEPYFLLEKTTVLPQRAEWYDGDSYFGKGNNSTFFVAPFQTYYYDGLYRATKRHACMVQKVAKTRDQTDYFSLFPDEIIIEIFCHISLPRDRSVCALVCKRWLMVQSHMRRSDIKMPLENMTGTAKIIPGKSSKANSEVISKRTVENSQSFVHGAKCGIQTHWSNGALSRCLQGKKATDLRLASMAVGSSASGGVGKLSIRGGKGESSAKAVSDFGLSAIAISCNGLKCLSLWDCPNIGNQGLIDIGNGCCLLKKLDLIKCPQLGNKGLESIARGCPLLSTLSLDSCAMIGSRGLEAVGRHCAGLLSLSVSKCPAVGDLGIGAVVKNCKILRVLKLERVSITDNCLTLLGRHCNSLLKLILLEHENLTEVGFASLGGSSGLKVLKHLAITSCQGVSDYSLPFIGGVCKALKFFSLADSQNITDVGLEAFVSLCESIEMLNLDNCQEISGSFIRSSSVSILGGLKVLHLNKCNGLSDDSLFSSSYLVPSLSLKSLSITNCEKVGNLFLEKIGFSCPSLEKLDLGGLSGVGDSGVLAFLQGNNFLLSTVNLNGCKNVTNKAVCAIAKHSGSNLRSLYLDGCEKVTDSGLKVIAEKCITLQDLDLSKCKITDTGLLALLATRGPSLTTLSLSGCEYITEKCLCIIQKVCGSLFALNLKGCTKLSTKALETCKSHLWRCDILSA